MFFIDKIKTLLGVRLGLQLENKKIILELLVIDAAAYAFTFFFKNYVFDLF
jgi:hypothetical protein